MHFWHRLAFAHRLIYCVLSTKRPMPLPVSGYEAIVETAREVLWKQLLITSILEPFYFIYFSGYSWIVCVCFKIL